MTAARLLSVLLFSLSTQAFAADQPRKVPDTPASFTLNGDQRWAVLVEKADGEAAIGIARDQVYDNPKVQVARTKAGKYAVLVGPQPQKSAEQLKEQFPRNDFPDLRQSRGEEFVARAWQYADVRLAAGELQEGKPVTLKTGGLTLTLRLQQVKKKKGDETYVVVSEGQEDGKTVFRTRSEALYSAETPAKASFVKLEGTLPQAVVSYYSGGAHCCAISSIATKDASGKWKIIEAGKLDGDGGYGFEDLDGDGAPEMLSGDNAFLYQFAPYASSRMPAKIEKLIGGKIVNVTRNPEYRRYHVQYLAAMEAGASDDNWKESGFLAAWVAQKVLLGEGADAFARMSKTFDPSTGAPFEECTIDRPVEKCPENRKKEVPFAEALRKFLDKNGYK